MVSLKSLSRGVSPKPWIVGHLRCRRLATAPPLLWVVELLRRKYVFSVPFIMKYGYAQNSIENMGANDLVLRSRSVCSAMSCCLV